MNVSTMLMASSRSKEESEKKGSPLQEGQKGQVTPPNKNSSSGIEYTLNNMSTMQKEMESDS